MNITREILDKQKAALEAERDGYLAQAEELRAQATGCEGAIRVVDHMLGLLDKPEPGTLDPARRYEIIREIETSLATGAPLDLRAYKDELAEHEKCTLGPSSCGLCNALDARARKQYPGFRRPEPEATRPPQPCAMLACRICDQPGQPCPVYRDGVLLNEVQILCPACQMHEQRFDRVVPLPNETGGTP